MHSPNSRNARKENAPSTLRSVVMFAALFYVILALQLIHTIKANAYGTSLSAIDVLGFIIALPMSTVLGLRLLMLGRLQIKAVSLVVILVFYIALIIAMTASNSDLISYFFTTSGLLPWFMIGIGVGGMLDVFRQARESQYADLARRLFILASLLASASFLPFTLDYLETPFRTLYYQAVANSASIFLVIAVSCIEALWGKRKPILVTGYFLTLSSILAAAVISMQSTSMAAIWLGLVLIFFWQQFWASNLFLKLLLVFGLASGIWYATNTQTFENIVTNTRFSELTAGSRASGFSSLSSRREILASFGDQFAISPISGHFEAEIQAGSGLGRYIHSLPLSFLTHTGIIGFTMISVILFLLLHRRVSPRRDVDPSELQFGRVMLVVLVLGTFTAFMTWSVLWFTMGLLTLKPRTIVAVR